jgi:predicted glycosyltransferase
MKTQAHKAMVEPFDVHPMTKLWTIINNNGLLIPRLNEYLKLVEITIVLVLKSIQDECAFFTIVFIKEKLQNWLNQHLDTIMCIFTQEFYTQKNSVIKMPLHIGKVMKICGLVLPLKKSCSFHVCKMGIGS